MELYLGTNESFDESLCYSNSLIDTQTIHFDLNALKPSHVHIPQKLYRKRLLSKLLPFNLNKVDVVQQLVENSVIENIQKINRRRSMRDSLLHGNSQEKSKTQLKKQNQVGKSNIKRRISMRQAPQKKLLENLDTAVAFQQTNTSSVISKMEEKQNIESKDQNYFLRKNSIYRSRIIKSKSSYVKKPLTLR